ncbi:MAG: MerC domain-containing protein [Gemmatimonadales bacterium]|nr:MAG: MerC domain-containing protein [Gemmatimonadales bacterium]
MRRFFPHPWGWASAAPILCAIHCALTPIVVVMAPALALGDTVEFALLGITIVLAAWALTRGLRQHGDMRPVLPIAIGLVAWGASLLDFFQPVPEEATTILATLVVAGGLIWNARLHCSTDAEMPCAHHGCEADAPFPGHPEPEAVVSGGTPEPAARTEAVSRTPAA